VSWLLQEWARYAPVLVGARRARRANVERDDRHGAGAAAARALARAAAVGRGARGRGGSGGCRAVLRARRSAGRALRVVGPRGLGVPSSSAASEIATSEIAATRPLAALRRLAIAAAMPRKRA
jgi:hypothetical protein